MSGVSLQLSLQELDEEEQLTRTEQIMVVSLAVCETAVLLASAYPGPLSDAVLSLLIYRERACIASVTLTTAFLMGWGMCVLGALLRMHCYRILGPQYTFERSVIREHQLVTSGPYAVVRHPAYTGFEVFHVGLLVVQFGQGSWAWECGVLDSWAGRAIVAGWVLYVYKLVVAVFRRCAAEDEMLRTEFGEKWVRWSQKTTGRLIPGVY